MSIKRKFKPGPIILGFSLLFLLARSAYAVPSLQLYIPGSEYIEGPQQIGDATITESWFIMANSFTLQVLGADQPNKVDYIKNVRLHFAILPTENPSAGDISLDGTSLTDLPSSPSWQFGRPSQLESDNALPQHGIYDTHFISIPLPDLMVSTAGQTVLNYNPGETGQDTGDIQTYQVSYERFFLVHIDLTGTLVFRNGATQDRFAPFSHDADSVVPEPATLFLLGAGLVVMGTWGRKRLRKNVGDDGPPSSLDPERRAGLREL